MSLNVKPLRVLRSRDNRLKLDQERFFTVEVGASQNTYRQVNASSFTNSNAQFTIIPPSTTTLLDRKLYIKFPRIQIDFTGTNATGNGLLNYGVHDALRAFPINSIISSMDIKLNDNRVSLTNQDLFPYLLRYYSADMENNNYDLSQCPNMQDQFQEYENGIGAARSELANYKSSDPFYNPRGAFPVLSFTNAAGGTTARMVFDITEPLFISPLMWGNQPQQSGFVHLTNLDININFSNLERIWSHANRTGITLTAINVSFLDAPQILCNFLSASPLDTYIPREVVYPYYDVQRYTTDVVGVNPGNVRTVTSNSVKLSSVPERIYAFVRKSNNTINQSVNSKVNSTDTFASMLRMSVDFENQNSLLANASQYDLYRIARRNGVMMSWAQWSGEAFVDGNNPPTFFYGPGSIMCLNVAKDISNQVLAPPGTLGEYQLQVTVDFQDIRSAGAAIDYSLYIVCVYPGTLTLSPGRASLQVGVLSQADYMNAKDMKELLNNESNVYTGGDFMSGLQRGADFLRRAVETGVDIGKKGVQAWNDLKKSGIPTHLANASEAILGSIPHPAATAAVEGVKVGRTLLGVGKRGRKPARRAGRLVGAGFEGGQFISRSQLKSKLDEYDDVYDDDEYY